MACATSSAPGQEADRGFTLVELMVAMAIGGIVLLTAAATMRMTSATILKANRLSIENQMLRTGIVMALDEIDFWNSYDHLHDPARQPLRDRAEPFHLDSVIAAGAAIDAAIHLPHNGNPKAIWRGFGYYSVYHDRGGEGDASYAASRAENRRWGDYTMVSSADYHDAGALHPFIAGLDAATVEDRSAYAEYQRRSLARFGYFAALDGAPANTLWRYREADGDFADHFRVTNHLNAPQPSLLVDNQAYHNSLPGDRLDLTNRALHPLTPDASTAPAGHQHHVWLLSQLLRAASTSGMDTVGSELASPWAGHKGIAASLQRREVVGAGEAPEDWPRVEVTRASWLFRGVPTYWVRVTVTDPLTGRQLALSLDGLGTSLRGARMQRHVLEHGGRF